MELGEGLDSAAVLVLKLLTVDSPESCFSLQEREGPGKVLGRIGGCLWVTADCTESSTGRVSAAGPNYDKGQKQFFK